MLSELTDEHADQNIVNLIESVQEDNEPKVLKGALDKQEDHMELEPENLMSVRNLLTLTTQMRPC